MNRPTSSAAASHSSKAARTFSARALLPLALAALVFVAVFSYAVARQQQTERHPLRATRYTQPWIRTAGEPSQAAHFRKRFDLPTAVRHAWVKIAACDAFEFSVNRDPMGRQYLCRPTRPFQSATSEKGQLLVSADPALALNFPREYQWDGHDHWRLPVYLDLTPAFRPGKNVVAVEVESRTSPACTTFEGEIELWSGEKIPLVSDESWLGEAAIPGPQLLDWTELYYWDKEWRSAVICRGPADRGLRSLPEPIFKEPFAGAWMQHPSASKDDPLTFSAEWNLPTTMDEAWLRLVSNRAYELWINGNRVRVASQRPPDLDNGDWVFGRGSAQDPTVSPELLDPDEVGSLFVGSRFESPRKADAQLELFNNPFAPKITPLRYERTHHRAQEAGVIEPIRTLAESRRTPETPDLFPEKPLPNALKQDFSTGGYFAYSIGPLLRPGKNRIEVRCLPQDQANWPTRVAVDGGAFDREHKRIELPGPQDWLVCESTAANQLASACPVGAANRLDDHLPPMQYRGIAIDSTTLGQVFAQVFWRSLAVVMIAIGLIWFSAKALDLRARHGDASRAEATHDEGQWPLRMSTAKLLFVMFLTASVTLIAGLLIDLSWSERQETIFCIDGTIWKYVFPLTLLSSLCVATVDTLGRVGLPRVRERGHQLTALMRNLPHSRIWFHLIVWILLLAAVLRAYKLDLQPLDDDEYASVQAILSIIETGVPRFVPEHVYYTRSPLFHYFTAVLAFPFGGNLWSLRLQSVGWGVATAWLTYLCGSHLLRSRWVGLIAMLLIAVHPFEIFTGHVIRFYQMQQFFALLTMYCFCRGFVGSTAEPGLAPGHSETAAPACPLQQSQGWRIATVAVFLCAVLSQEITVAITPALILGYLMFAKDLGWKKNIELGLYTTVAVGLIGLDYLIFQTCCLTRTEGVSPSMEAAVSPHFWYPLNFLSMFVGYSRLHVVPSLFLLCGLPLLWRENNRGALALLAFLVSGIMATNLLVTNVSWRYLYWLVPVWLLLSMEGLRLVLTTIVSTVYAPTKHLNRYVATTGLCCGICIASILASWSLWRIPGSYETKLLGDSTAALRWVRSQKRPNDRIAVTEPHTHCAYLEAGQCDYDISIPVLYDFVLAKDGKLVDRNAGAAAITNLDALIEIFGQGERIWLVLNREKFRTRGKNLRWEYPGARFELFVRKNCELKFQTYLWSVYLWDPANGHYMPFQLQE